jgi:hypothetical protein
MNINCRIFCKDRTIETVKVNARHQEFTFNKGLYVIPKEAVNLFKLEGKPRYEPELVFIEGEPLPVNAEKTSTASSDFLTRIVIRNALKQSSRMKSEMFGLIADYMRNPGKIILLVFALTIVGALISAFMGGF